MKNERTRMFIALMLAMVLSVLCTLMITVYAFSDARRQEVRRNQYGLALAAIELRQRSELTTEEILSTLSSSGQHLTPVEAEQADRAAAAQALAGQVVFDAAHWQTVFLLDGTLCAVRQDNTGLVPRIVSVYLLLTVAAFGALTVLIGHFTAERMVRPLTALSEAVQRIAQGDFSVRLPQKKRMSAQMRGLTEGFNAMAEALSSVEYLRRDFTASVSHEIKTPVAAIHAYAQLMQMPGADAQAQREYAEAIVRESRRLSGLSDSLLRLTRLESENAPLSRARYRIGEQLREIAASLLPSMEDKRIAFEADIPDAAAVADEELMGQVFLNVLGNAIKFTPEGGAIRVFMRRTPDMLTVSIEDTGCGMDEETISHIFEKFYQADRSHATQGVGLGLALVRRIMQLHGGRVEVESEPEKGSKFILFLPQ